MVAVPEVGQLAVPLGGDDAVVLAVGHAEEVALRLGVADKENFCCHDSFFALRAGCRDGRLDAEGG